MKYDERIRKKRRKDRLIFFFFFFTSCSFTKVNERFENLIKSSWVNEVKRKLILKFDPLGYFTIVEFLFMCVKYIYIGIYENIFNKNKREFT